MIGKVSSSEFDLGILGLKPGRLQMKTKANLELYDRAGDFISQEIADKSTAFFLNGSGRR
jgi:hypothetical protein